MAASVPNWPEPVWLSSAFTRLGIGLEEEAMVLNSDTDAYVNVKNEACAGEDIHDWTIRRLAVKLAGSMARILQTGEAIEWDTVRSSPSSFLISIRRLT